MPFDTVANLKNPTTYKTTLKAELNKVKDKPVKFQFFDNFPFTGKRAPLLVVGAIPPDLVDEIKNSGGAFKAAGRCAMNDETLEFTADRGKVEAAKLKVALDGTPQKDKAQIVKTLKAGEEGKDEVKSEPQAQGSVETGSPEISYKPKAESRLTAITKAFNAVKGKIDDGRRKELHGQFEKVQQKMDAQKFSEALTELDRIEQNIKSSVTQNQQWAEQKLEKTEKEVAEKKAAVKKKLEDFQRGMQPLELHLEGLKTEVKKGQPSGMKFDKWKAKLEGLQNSIKDSTEKLELKKTELKSIQDEMKEIIKSGDKDVGDMLKLYQEIGAKTDELLKSAKEAEGAPGKIKDDPSAKGAQDNIKEQVGKMAEAAEFQKQNVKATEGGANMHGTGRHGAQTGMDRQARRAATGGTTTDQDDNEAGVTRHIADWNQIKIEYEKDENGKNKIKNKTVVAKHLIENATRKFNTTTASMFANPILEKEAVDKAVGIANAKCKWKEIKKGATWVPLVELAIDVPKPDKAPGYGYSLKLVDTTKKVAVTDADAILKDFETGKIKTIDELLEKLNVQLTKDSTGEGVKMIPHAKVVLTRANAAAPWVSKTHFPDERIGAAGWDLQGKQVRVDGTTPAGEVAGGI